MAQPLDVVQDGARRPQPLGVGRQGVRQLISRHRPLDSQGRFRVPGRQIEEVVQSAGPVGGAELGAKRSGWWGEDRTLGRLWGHTAAYIARVHRMLPGATALPPVPRVRLRRRVSAETLVDAGKKRPLTGARTTPYLQSCSLALGAALSETVSP